MVVNMLTWIVLMLVAGVFFWLARRALRLRNPAARWALAVLAVLPGLTLALVGGVIGLGYAKLYMPRSTSIVALDTAVTPARIERGAYLARTTCVACHATNNQLPLSGGIDLSAHSPVPVGSVVPPNLTPGGSLKDWSDSEIANAIRNGRHKNGRLLFAMPAAMLRNLSDDDLASLVVFLRSQPAVINETPAVAPSLLIAAITGAGLVEMGTVPQTESVAAPVKQANVEYGEYVMSYQDCKSCHGEDLNGGAGDLGPATPSVYGAIRGWTVEQFIQTMRTGVDPAGHHIQEPMPWQMLGNMDDTELTALYLYLQAEDKSQD